MKRTLFSVAMMALAVMITTDAGAFSFGKTKYLYKKGAGTWVKVCPGNKKQGPFDHPKDISSQDMTKALSSLMYFRPGFFSVTGKKGKDYQVFTDEEVAALADYLVQAFAEADSKTWVDFSLNSFRGQILLGSFRQTDGVMFVKDGKINVALRNIAVKTSGDDPLNSFDPTRGYRSMTKLTAIPGQDQVADNWVSMSLSDIPVRSEDAVSEQPLITIPNPDDKKTGDTTTEPQPQPQPQPPAPPEKSAQERLLELQKLYDQGLITKEEYEKKRKEILDEL